MKPDKERPQPTFPRFHCPSIQPMTQIRPEAPLVLGLSKREGQMAKHEMKEGRPTAETLAVR